MKKSIIAATFGGVLASGFLTVAAPASAAPCGQFGENGLVTSPPCIACQQASIAATHGADINQRCYGSNAPGETAIQAPPGPPNQPGYGRDRACAESGVCPGAAWVNRNGGLKTAPPCVHFPDDPPGLCAPVSPDAKPTLGAINTAGQPCKVGVTADCYLPNAVELDPSTRQPTTIPCGTHGWNVQCVGPKGAGGATVQWPTVD